MIPTIIKSHFFFFNYSSKKSTINNQNSVFIFLYSEQSVKSRTKGSELHSLNNHQHY